MGFCGHRGRLGPSPTLRHLLIGRKASFGRLLHLPEKIQKISTKDTNVNIAVKGLECQVIFRSAKNYDSP